jgi:hypothetical protein
MDFEKEIEDAKKKWQENKKKIALWAAGITGFYIGYKLGSHKIIFMNK